MGIWCIHNNTHTFARGVAAIQPSEKEIMPFVTTWKRFKSIVGGSKPDNKVFSLMSDGINKKNWTYRNRADYWLQSWNMCHTSSIHLILPVFHLPNFWIYLRTFCLPLPLINELSSFKSTSLPISFQVQERNQKLCSIGCFYPKF